MSSLQDKLSEKPTKYMVNIKSVHKLSYDHIFMTYFPIIIINTKQSIDKFSRQQTNDIFLIFPENMIRHFKQIGDTLHVM